MSKNLCNRYEKMTEAQLDSELSARGIDPERTISAVLRLLREKLQEGYHRGSHHLLQGKGWQWIAAMMVFQPSLAIGWNPGSKAA